VNRITVLIFLLSSVITFANANELTGNYSAVTETELNVDLIIENNKKVTLKTELYAVEDGYSEWTKIEKGTWERNKNILTVHLEAGKIITYGIKECLPYSEFGYKGCSFGLKPTNQNRNGLWFGLWKTEELKKLWKKKP